MAAATSQRLLGKLRENAQLVASLTGVLGVVGITTYAFARNVVQLQTERELREKDVEAERKIGQEQVEAVLAKAQRDIAIAQKETAERFLLYGYAAEFERYQKAAQKAEQKE